MSLRARLVITLLVLATAGMVLLGSVTYATQRSFQEARVDDQTRAAVPALGRQLDQQSARVPGAPVFGPPGGRRPRGGPDPTVANLPPGTYGERRDASGAVVGKPVVLSYGENPLPPPKLPKRLVAGRLFTVDAVSGGGHYRVRTVASPGGIGLIAVAVPLNGVQESLDRLLLVEALVIVGVLVLLAVFGSMLVRVGLRPLDRIGQTAGAIAAGDLSRRVETASPRTEVGRLGLSLNAMLARLEQAFAERQASEARLRQFLSDASHELRTPLASIRGYAELFRIGAARMPEDTEKAMRRIEDEAARMGVLVEDLLILARLDETRERSADAVDVAELTADAAEDARAMAPDREVTVTAAPAPTDAIVLGDESQLRQVLANLVRNAVVHTPAGTPIALSTSCDDGHVDIVVRDHGPGLPTDAPDDLFERFWRAERGRERGRAGAGLGLAIVAGIVAAHGGAVAAANAPDGGAVFRVRLPLAGAGAGAGAGA